MNWRYRFTLVKGTVPGTQAAKIARQALETWRALKPRERQFSIASEGAEGEWLLAEVFDDGDEESPCEEHAPYFAQHGLDCHTTEAA
ncbi:MAG TPA: hypothetical protein VND91_05240 [Candidatus Saccharimonadia bacterium]|nr:hypothetical protein [Candidatus Saccharimonadia bacterium]